MNSDLAEGSVIDGYRIDGHLAHGGMGVVYRARHVALDLPVALKLIRPERAQDPSYRERFKREARMAASLRHPHVVTPQDFGEYENELYVVMPLIDATDLAVVITETGPLDTERAAKIVDEIADALGAAHAAGLIHRDVKPANILLAPDRGGGEKALLTDFGIARAVVSETHLTQGDQLPGTPGYVSPEQIQGTAVDQRSDIYSLGCVLCEALTGSVPYPRHTPALMLMAHISEDPPRVSERVAGVPEAFDAVVRQALAKDPADRFATAADLAGAVREAAAREQAAPTAVYESPPAPAPEPAALDPPARPPATGAPEPAPAWTEPARYGSGSPAGRVFATLGIAAAVGAAAGLVGGALHTAILRSSILQGTSDFLDGRKVAVVFGFAVMTVIYVGALALATYLARRPGRPAAALLGALLVGAVLGTVAGYADTQVATRVRLELFYLIVGVAAGAACGLAARSGRMFAMGSALGAVAGLVAGAVRKDDPSSFIGINTLALTLVALGVGLAYALAFRPEAAPPAGQGGG